MASDYERIRAENIEEYGKGTRHLAFLGQLYTDRTHFLFELLQNAEDAKAHTVSLYLYPDRLEMYHDGRLFNENDVQGVCGVGAGTKADDLTQIGKFGIGFKSVYAYTSNPEIHCGEERFRIEHYVRPYASVPRQIKPGYTTLFVFPFDHNDISPGQAFTEIGYRLRELNIRTLLFLHNITEITWEVQDAANGFYLREETAAESMRRIHVIGQTGDDIDEEEWLVFERAVVRPEKETPVTVEAAFLIVKDERTGTETIVHTFDTDLVVFFPTQKETHLGFLIQGPYRTTPSRDNVSSDDPTNKRLIQETATLIAEALPLLRDEGLLTVSLLEAMPIRSSDFPSNSMFRPIFDRVRRVLREQELLPTSDGGYVGAARAKLARGAEMLALLTPQQLGELLGNGQPLRWLSQEITEDATPDLYRYLVGRVTPWYSDTEAMDGLASDIEVRPPTLVRAITSSFLAKQPDEWIEKLYVFLGNQRAQWQLLRDRPIVRLGNDQQITPFRSDGRPNAYLPTDQAFDLPFVKRSIVANPQALRFLRDLGLAEPDLMAVVAERVLPKYEASTVNVAQDEHDDDLKKIFVTLRLVTGAPRDTWIARLKSTTFFRTVDVTDTAYYVQPEKVYIWSAALELYFGDNPAVYYLAEPSLDSVPDEIYELGVSNAVRIMCKRGDSAGHVVAYSQHGWHKRGLNGFDPTFEIDGLEHALSNADGNWCERSVYIWNSLLIPHRNQIRGEVETSTRQDYTKAKRTVALSPVGKLLTTAPWLMTDDGDCVTLDSVSLDDLPAGYVRDEILAQALGMKPAALATLARAVDVPVEHVEFMLTHQEAFERFMRDEQAQERRLQAQQHDGEVDAPFDYATELRDAFAHPAIAAAEMTDDGTIATDVSNPERWRGKARAEIEDARETEPLLQTRFVRVPRKVWEEKNSEVRLFLDAEYGGRCQICDTVFVKRDGTPYYEGLYLVRRIHAQWIGREGNVLCLCPTCCAKMLYGTVEADDILSQMESFRAIREGGDGHPTLHITLCGTATRINYTERHIIFLQELLKVAGMIAPAT